MFKWEKSVPRDWITCNPEKIIQRFFEYTHIIIQTAEYSILINIILDDLFKENSFQHNGELFRKIKIYERISY